MRAEDFMNYVDDSDPDGCWPWLRGCNSGGYGVMWLPDGPVYTHVFSYRKYRGDIPEGLKVLHTCDNRPCAKPSHLFLGADKDNAADKSAKGRCNTPRGAIYPQSKLTEDVVRIIRFSDLSNRKLAALFGVNHTTIGRVKRREDWPHVL